MKKYIGIIIIAVIIIAVGLAAWQLTAPGEKTVLTVSTTTSLYQTEVLDALAADFEELYPNIDVAFLSQGTGLAIQTAKNGDADMIIVHDATREAAFLEEGYGVNRKIIAYNFFVIVGPEDDPAGINGMDPLEALQTIKAAGEAGEALWISRGDSSGTHGMEKRLWTAAGEDSTVLRESEWYIERGAGMTETLTMSNEKLAYTLTDMGTYLKTYTEGLIELVIQVEAGQQTLNVYSAIACDPQNASLSHVNFDAAMKFIDFLVSDDAQDTFATFGVADYGQALFNPAVDLLEHNTDPTIAGWIRDAAFVDGSECPANKRYNAGNLTFVNAVSSLNALIYPLVK